MPGKKVLLAFSGGADSCRATELLSSQGYGVTALTMDMTGDVAMMQTARSKAEALGLEHQCVDAKDIFRKKVENYFVTEYLRGRTPAPCTVCNAEVKWRLLHDMALESGYDHIATGHYMDITVYNGLHYVSRAEDERKDQSYYLWMLPQDILRMALAPMSAQRKSDIELDRSYRESMGVCFLRGRDYAEYITESIAGCPADPAGNIIDESGSIVGRHNGIFRYTIGQKRGVGIPSGSRVVGIDAPSRTLIVGGEERILHKNLLLSGCRFTDEAEVMSATDISVKIRGIGRNPEGGCRIVRHGDGVKVTLEEPAWAPAPGQPVVFYRGLRVVGGGILEESF